MRDLILVAADAAIRFAGVFVFIRPDIGSSMFTPALVSRGQDCSIKGNVSIGSRTARQVNVRLLAA